MSAVDILQKIADRRRRRLAAEGPTLGVTVPPQRQVPLVPFPVHPAVICEVKRRSPSRGAIREDADPVAVAQRYQAAGARSVSVLTEEDHFCGSLADLVAVKAAMPELSVLRKDFLLDMEDLEVSYLAGADAVLLIVGLLDDKTLAELYHGARELGLAALVEVHTPAELRRAAVLRPTLLGINSRDLVSFSIDRLVPVALRGAVTWPCHLIFESGILCYQDAFFAATHGFSGVLVGEAAMRDPGLIPQLIRAVTDGFAAAEVAAKTGAGRFWDQLLARRHPGRPLVKICGITNRSDAEAAVRAGADILGFVCAPSPRRAPDALPAELAGLDVLKVAVVVCEGEPRRLPDAVSRMLADGVIDAVQFHGDETPQECFSLSPSYFKALRLGTAEDAAKIDEYRSPRVLIDAFSADLYGGTGKTLSTGLVSAAARKLPLWIAGGIGPQNVGELIQTWRPELIDASSRLEAEPGRKDHQKIAAFMKEIDDASDL